MIDDKKYLYQEIILDIKKRIKKEEFKKDQKIGTEKSLCDYYDVSRSTIRTALEYLEDQNYIYKVIGKGTFVNISSNYFNSKEKIIKIIVPALSRDFISDVVIGAQEIISKSHYNSDLCVTNNSIKDEKTFIKEAFNKKVSGIIIHPVTSNFYNEDLIKIKNSIPTIMTGRYYEFINCNYVVANNYNGSYKITKYLIENGHKNIGLISEKPLIQTSIKNRIKGYEDCLSEHGICLNKNNMLIKLEDSCKLYSSENRKEEYRDMCGQIKSFLKKRAFNLTAIFATNDFLANEVNKIAKDLDLKIPRDLSIVGFDNVFLAEKSTPPLTTINWSQKNIGKTAANNLLELIKNKKDNSIKKVLPTKIVERATVRKYSN